MARVRSVIASRIRVAIDLPSFVKLEREVVQLDQLQRGEMFEQRIRRLRRQHRIAGIAEQLEEKRIRLARRRGDDDVVRIARQLARDRLARGRDAERLRIVRRARGAGHDLRELIERIAQSRLRRIRVRQIEQRAAIRVAREREPVDGSVPLRAFGEHGDSERIAFAAPQAHVDAGWRLVRVAGGRARSARPAGFTNVPDFPTAVAVADGIHAAWYLIRDP